MAKKVVVRVRRAPNKTRGNVVARVSRKMRGPKRARLGNGSNSDAAKYRRLLVDPCGANLVSTPYEGSLGGRVERNVGAVVTGTGFSMFCYHPVLGLFGAEPPDAVTPSYLARYGDSAGGTANPGESRAIAGCLSTTYIGAESARSGTVSCGVVPGTLVYNYLKLTDGGANNSFLVGVAVQKLASIERMPVDKCEVNWFPGVGDEQYAQPWTSNSAMNSSLFSRANFMCIVIQNAPAGYIQMKTVGVREVIDNSGTAGTTPWNVNAPEKPSYDWKSVLTSITSQDPTWYLNTFMKAGRLLGGAAAAYGTMGLPGALGYLTSQAAGMAPRGRMNVRSG